MLSNDFLTEETDKNFSWVSRKWVRSKGICYTVSGSPQNAQDTKTVGRHQKVGASVLSESDQFAVYSELLGHTWRSVCSVPRLRLRPQS